MFPDFENDRRIVEACKDFGVRRLHIFGSAAERDLDPDSDVDFLVEFERAGFGGAFDQFMGLKERLEVIFERPVDLLTNRHFRNALFQEEVEKTKKLVYAA